MQGESSENSRDVWGCAASQNQQFTSPALSLDQWQPLGPERHEHMCYYGTPCGDSHQIFLSLNRPIQISEKTHHKGPRIRGEPKG